ncbi:MAG: hypothetical protein CBB72_011575 [Muricauda sp. TMED12]|nr:MAG: hypothetical protein CBB72_011575 [Muricauda sp. TMED12]
MNNFYFGVVEDRLDPEKMGRVRVRVLGYHSPNISEVPTASLPWAAVMTPTTSPSVNGIGQTPFLIEGSWVVLIFRDQHLQDPIVIGTVPGHPEQKRSSSVGFSDPRGYYPRDGYLDEPDVNQRARGLRRREKNPSNLEPLDPYKAVYPYNHVVETESGHLIEYDDTPNHERIMIQHRSGSFIEMHPNGDVRIRSNNQYNTSLGEMVINVDGNAHVTVSNDLDVQVQGNSVIDTVGNSTVSVGGNLQAHVKGTSTLNLHGNVALNSEGNLTVRAEGDFDLAVKGKIKLRAEKELDLAVKTTSKISSIGNMHLEAPRIDLNPAGQDPTTVDAIDVAAWAYDQGHVDVTVPKDEPLFTAAELYKIEMPTSQRAQAQDETADDGTRTAATGNTVSSDTITSTTETTTRDITLLDPAVGSGSVTYVNQQATRSLKLNSVLENIITSAASATGLHVAIFSGGQNETTGSVGSHRHDDGYAADIWIYTDEARTNRIYVANGDAQTVAFIQALRSAGAESIGAGPGYMGGVGIHVDIAKTYVPEVTYAGYWGAGGKSANAPSWLSGIFV